MTFTEFLNTYNIRLNQQQLDAVQSVEGPVLLLAVPGSGKTTVLVTRLGYMIYCRGIAPEKILTLTYTVAATHDMAKRFEQYFGPELGHRLEFRTINGICARVINYYGRMVGKNAFHLVTDEKATAGMLSLIFQETEGTYPTESDMKSVRTWITYIKNRMLQPDQIQELEDEAGVQIGQIYKKYCAQMRRQGLMDYDDQMIYALNILRHSPETLQYFQNRYPYICVDEAQDTSKIQHAIIALLSHGSGNLFMVGDEDQSIYGFRAAYPEALLSFEKNHPGAKVLFMEENFRSNAKIVAAADRFIQKNTLRREKHMKAVREAGADIREIQLKSRRSQYSYLEKVAMNCQTQTAVLYRDNESVLPLVDRLERRGIPYRMRNGDLTFFTHRTVLDIQNIICFAMNQRDTDLFMQIYYKINLYISRQNAIRFCKISREKGISVLEAAVCYGGLPDYTVKSINGIRTHLEKLPGETADKAIDRITGMMGYGDYLERMKIGDGKIFVMREIGAMEDSAQHFLERMEQLQQIIREKQNEPSCPFILSTIHASKGLEYDSVYLLDVADGIFPENVPAVSKEYETDEPGNYYGKNNRKTRENSAGKTARKEIEAYEEERRLFYVGVTRAKNNLNVFKIPSFSTFCRELTEMIRENTTNTGQKSRQKQLSGSSYMKPKKVFSQAEYDAFCDSLGEGIGVVHQKFGQGIVSAMSDEYVTVHFDEISRKMSLHILFENDLLKVR